MGKLKEEEFPKTPHKSGWPWDCEVDESIYEEFKEWPKITIITPCYNQSLYIEETIRSILLQNYPNLEYIVIDGQSIDDSKQLIEKYTQFISYWISEPDMGQSHAINKGIFFSTGSVLNWINSDDLLNKYSLYYIGKEFIKANNKLLLIIGNGFEINEKSVKIKERTVDIDININRRLFFKFNGNPIQQSIFFSKQLVVESGGINPLIKYPMDIELYYKMSYLNPEVRIINQFLGAFRKHSDSKTISRKIEMLVEKINLIEYLSNFDTNKEYYSNLVVSYILGTSLKEAKFGEKVKFVFKGFKILKLTRNNFYKYKILLKKLII